MSAFLVKRGATMVTKEEAKAAVETEIALNPARPMTSLKGRILPDR
jgi:hypothetical protein